MHKPIKYVEKGLAVAANGAWAVFNGLNQIKQNPSFTPAWSDKPILKSYEKTKPPLGWPRETDSLCPTCTREARQEILDGKKDVSVLLNEKVGEIKATILERDGKILMVKDCPIHGHFEDVMAIDTAFFKHLEDVFPGRDIRAHNDEKLHNHGSSTIKHGRGAVLTVDLTNRCNMMCDPCFMDANQVGFVHELTWDDIRMVLDNAISIKPRRQMSVQFSGGEPTISPYFLDAVSYARKVGYNSVQAATNGIEFAKNPEFARKAAEAGLRYAYLQFDGIGNAANAHRRAAQRYTLSHLAHDVKNQTGIGEPVRDWFPISFMGSFTDWADVTHGAEKEFGQLTCGCHPNCGVGMAIMIDKETKEAVPVTAFLKAEQLAKDVASVSDAGRGRFLSVFGMALALVRNYDSFKSPTHFKLTDLLKKFDKTFGATKSAEKGKYGKVEGTRTMDDIAKRRADRWNFLFIAGMWFQDLFNYDFRRTEMCIIPYATQQGEISFCAYNTGIGWRNIIEKMHMTATLTKCYEEHGRHEIFAGGKKVDLPSTAHSLKLNEDAVRAGAQTDLDDLGIAKNAREEKLAARKHKTPEEAAKEAQHNAEMAKLYAQHVLKEQPTLQIQGLGGKKKASEPAEVLHKPVV